MEGSSNSSSLSSRRRATAGLPPFSMPPRQSDVPSMASNPPDHDKGHYMYTLTPPNSSDASGNPSLSPSHRIPDSIYAPRSSVGTPALTPTIGAGDGISPAMSGVHSAGSQGSQTQPNLPQHYTISNNPGQGSWAAPSSSSYGAGSPTQTRPQGFPQYEPRPSVYGQQSTGVSFMNPRNSHSPATGGEGLPTPYDQNPHSYPPPPSAPGAHTASQSQLPAPTNPSSHMDFSSTRPPSASNFQITAPTQSYQLPSPTQQPSPSNLSHRGMGPMGGQYGQSAQYGQPTPPVMAPPQQYRPNFSYQQMHHMQGAVMPGVHHPGAQVALLQGNMQMPHAVPPHMMYPQQVQAPPLDRPFKCDICGQSFSRNHDLKRHKRIHLPVKPFPCNYCSKTFSRKDALKRHRLVKGCEEKARQREQERAAQGGEATGEDNDSPTTSSA